MVMGKLEGLHASTKNLRNDNERSKLRVSQWQLMAFQRYRGLKVRAVLTSRLPKHPTVLAAELRKAFVTDGIATNGDTSCRASTALTFGSTMVSLFRS